jgi:hypothetical protein
MGLNATYMLGSFVALIAVIFTLSRRRMEQRKQFNDTTQFRNFEQKNDKGRVLMLRLSLALTLVNFLFWGSDIATNLYTYFEPEDTSFTSFWHVYELLYTQLVPLRGFVHFLAIWTALKWEVIVSVFPKKRSDGDTQLGAAPTNDGTSVTEADTMMQRSLQFGGYQRSGIVHQEKQDAALGLPALDSTRIDIHSINIPMPKQAMELDLIGSERNQGQPLVLMSSVGIQEEGESDESTLETI